MPGNNFYLGLDIGGTKCAAVLGTLEGEIIGRREWPSQAARGPIAMIDELCGQGEGLLLSHEAVALGVGVSIGGPLDAERGIIHHPPHLPGWDGVALKEILVKRFHVPVAVEHDAAACALAEYRWGAGKGSRRLIYLTCGTGFGAGLVFDGKIYRGADGLNCEIGFVRYRDDGPEAFGKRGCFEAFASAEGLSRIAAWKFPRRWASRPPTPQEINALFQEKDADAAEVVRINAQAVGDACAFLSDTLRPDLILLGSLAHYLGETWLRQVEARWRSESLPASQRVCKILPAGLGVRLQDCSALVTAIEGLNKGREQ